MKEGWIKLHRCLLDNPIVMKDSAHLAIWTYLLLEATHKEYPKIFRGKKIMLKPGQLITGRKVVAQTLGISEMKVRRVLNDFESDQQIDRQSSNKNSLITIVNWDLYQNCDQQSDQQPTNNRPTTDQQPTTLQECKNVKNVKKNKQSNKELDDLRQRFEQLYQTYHELHRTSNGKSKARDKYIRLCTTGCKVGNKTVKLTPERIEAAFERYVQDHIESEERNGWAPQYKNIDTVMNNITDWEE